MEKDFIPRLYSLLGTILLIAGSGCLMYNHSLFALGLYLAVSGIIIMFGVSRYMQRQLFDTESEIEDYKRKLDRKLKSIYEEIERKKNKD